MTKVLEDSLPVPVEDAGVVLASLTRIPQVWDLRWSEGRVHWKVDVPRGEESCAHLEIRRVIDRCLSTHRVHAPTAPALRTGS